MMSSTPTQEGNNVSQTTVDADGNVVTTTIEGRKAFVNFERSISVKPYETAKASCHLQVDLPEQIDESVDLNSYFKQAFSVAKANVFQQLGLDYEVDEVNLVVIEKLERELGAEVVEGPKPKKATARKSAPSKRGGKPSDEQIEAAWEDLQANPDGWFDNRSDKRNPKAPDFKAKNNNKNIEGGFALWLDSMPSWFDEPPI